MKQIPVSNAFLFIAKRLEGIGQPKNDNNLTIFGITKAHYPEYYDKLRNALDNNQSVKDVIVEAYSHIYNEAGSDRLTYPLNVFHFDFYFNSPKGVKTVTKQIQKLLNRNGAELKVDRVLGPMTEQVLILHTGCVLGACMLFNTLRRQYYLTHSRHQWWLGLMTRVQKLESFILT